MSGLPKAEPFTLMEEIDSGRIAGFIDTELPDGAGPVTHCRGQIGEHFRSAK